MLIIAEDIEGEAWPPLWLTSSAAYSTWWRWPGFGARRKAMLEDIAVLTEPP